MIWTRLGVSAPPFDRTSRVVVVVVIWVVMVVVMVAVMVRMSWRWAVEGRCGPSAPPMWSIARTTRITMGEFLR